MKNSRLFYFLFATLSVLLFGCGKPTTQTFENPAFTIDLLPRWEAESRDNPEIGPHVVLKYEGDAMLKVYLQSGREDRAVFSNITVMNTLMETAGFKLKGEGDVFVKSEKGGGGFGGIYQKVGGDLEVPFYVVYPQNSILIVEIAENYRPFAVNDMVKMIKTIR